MAAVKSAASKSRRAPTPPRLPGPSKAELLRQYRRTLGVTPSPRATNKWLATEISTARAAYNANRISAVVQAVALTTAAVGTYQRVRAEQAADPSKRSIAGDTVDKLAAAGQAAYSVAPGVAFTMLQGSANAFAHTVHHLPLGLYWNKIISGPAEAVAKVAGRAVLPALAAWSMHREAMADVDPLRGAGRGLVRAIDPTGIVMARGLGERAYDAVLGKSPDRTPPAPGWFESSRDPKFQYQPNAYERFVNGVAGAAMRRVLPASGAFLNPTSAPAASPKPRRILASTAPVAAAPHVYKDTWTDNRGRTYTRRDLSVRKSA